MVASRRSNLALDAVHNTARAFFCLILMSTAVFVHADGLSTLESSRIEYLIASVETLKDAQFIRNNTAYDAKAAAAHLRLKLRNAGSRVTTAEDFIRLCASVSSMSGKPYLIRYADGRTVTAESFFQEKLTEYGR